jgi:hypothetical protein
MLATARQISPASPVVLWSAVHVHHLGRLMVAAVEVHCACRHGAGEHRSGYAER